MMRICNQDYLMPRRSHTSYKEHQINVAELFRPVARKIAMCALEEVVHALSSPETAAGLSDDERRPLSDRSHDRKPVRLFTEVVTDEYQAGVGTLEQASVETERSIAIEILRRSLNRYRRGADGDPIEYYEKRIEPLFKALALPHSALLRVDGNLASCLPRRPVTTMRAMRSMQEQRKDRAGARGPA
jgi:hypothetical protein